jgi:hypothetical protein
MPSNSSAIGRIIDQDGRVWQVDRPPFPGDITRSHDVELTPDDLREIGEAASRIAVHGHRYSEDSEKMIDR